MVARVAHNHQVGGSNPSPATVGDVVFRRCNGERIGVVQSIDGDCVFAGPHWWHRDAITNDFSKDGNDAGTDSQGR